MYLRLIGHVQAVRFLQWTLFVGVHIDMALDALLAVVGPRIPRHPLSLTLRTLVLSETAFLALVRGFPFRFWTSLRTVSYVVTLPKAQMAQIVCRWQFTVLQRTASILQLLLLMISGNFSVHGQWVVYCAVLHRLVVVIALR